MAPLQAKVRKIELTNVVWNSSLLDKTSVEVLIVDFCKYRNFDDVLYLLIGKVLYLRYFQGSTKEFEYW